MHLVKLGGGYRLTTRATDGRALLLPFRDVARRLRSRDAGRSILRVFYDEDIGLSGVRLVLSFSLVALRIRALVESLLVLREKGSSQFVVV